MSEIDPLGQDAILVIRHGSHLYGTNTPESDLDFKGVCVEPPDLVFGTQQFEQHETKPRLDDTKTMTGVEEGVIYSLRKFARLALKGNPNSIECLFAPEQFVLTCTAEGERLRSLREAVVSQRTIKQYLGYLHAQIQRMNGERGGHNASRRDDIIAKFGYDTKQAYHIIRLGLQALELARTRSVTFPFTGEELALLKSIRDGGMTKEDVVALGYDLERQVEELGFGPHSILPESPDEGRVMPVIIDIYRSHWGWM